MDSIDIAKGMNGMSLIGALFGEFEKNISAVPFVLAGDMDEQLYRGFFLQHYGTKAEYRENDNTVNYFVEQLKMLLRRRIEIIFQQAEHQEKMQRQADFERLRVELRQSNKPSEYGTVAEIAAKLGISKSEVRRRKAEGTLDELFLKISQPT